MTDEKKINYTDSNGPTPTTSAIHENYGSEEPADFAGNQNPNESHEYAEAVTDRQLVNTVPDMGDSF